MFLTLHIPWIMFTADTVHPKPALVPAGTYAVERIPNPRHVGGRPWIIIEGTTIGMNEHLATEMTHVHFGDFQLELALEKKP